MPPPSYEAHRKRLTRAVDKAFAEEVRLVFMRDGRVDPDRPEAVVTAPLRSNAGDVAAGSSGSRNRWKTSGHAEGASLRIDRDAYDGPDPRKGDRVQATSREGSPWFEVSSVDDRDHVRIIVNLGDAS